MTLAGNPSCNPLCRACHYKDLDYAEQLRRKQHWAESQLGRWGSALREIVPAPENERLSYRSKSWMRSAVIDGNVSFGMLRSVRVGEKWEKELISWDTCPLHIVPIQKMIEKLRQALSRNALRFAEESLEGIWIGSPHLVIVSKHQKSEEMEKLDWREILEPPFDRVWFHCNPQVGKKIFGHHEIRRIFGEESGASHPIRAFRQVAQTLLVQARSSAVEALLRSQPSLVVDLYCGTGELSRLLPREVGWLGVEHSREAIKYANTLRPSGGAGALQLGFVGGVEQRLRDSNVLSRITGSYALYVNPPRPGLGPGACAGLVDLMHENAPVVIAYLSCSASSLARDLEVLERAGYAVAQLQPFDFFPQTEHFETLAILRPN
ncbi:MAG: hypothetical protein P4M08_14905 [Oligoflexia bacterium]|nr:hypothetical protein [Oligoflexia bacterium]